MDSEPWTRFALHFQKRLDPAWPPIPFVGNSSGAARLIAEQNLRDAGWFGVRYARLRAALDAVELPVLCAPIS